MASKKNFGVVYAGGAPGASSAREAYAGAYLGEGVPSQKFASQKVARFPLTAALLVHIGGPKMPDIQLNGIYISMPENNFVAISRDPQDPFGKIFIGSQVTGSGRVQVGSPGFLRTLRDALQSGNGVMLQRIRVAASLASGNNDLAQAVVNGVDSAIKQIKQLYAAPAYQKEIGKYANMRNMLAHAGTFQDINQPKGAIQTDRDYIKQVQDYIITNDGAKGQLQRTLHPDGVTRGYGGTAFPLVVPGSGKRATGLTYGGKKGKVAQDALCAAEDSGPGITGQPRLSITRRRSSKGDQFYCAPTGDRLLTSEYVGKHLYNQVNRDAVFGRYGNVIDNSDALQYSTREQKKAYVASQRPSRIRQLELANLGRK